MIETDKAISPGKKAVAIFFLASGTASLIYQVVWTRELVLLFGNTTQAIVTTVSAFLAGLGFGALLGGLVSTRLRNPLKAYGLLEIGVGAFALAMPLAFNAIAHIFPKAYLHYSPSLVALIRFALAFTALTPVTLLMGMTLPVLTRHFIRAEPEMGSRIAFLYGINTLGAVIGTLASGLVLIELRGLRGTTWIAATLNVLVGIGAIVHGRSRGALPVQEDAQAQRQSRQPISPLQKLLLGATLISGFVSLSYEVLWTRLIMQGTGGFIYLFVAVLAVFLTGIAVGSLAYEIRSRHAPPRLQTLVSCLLGIGVLGIVPAIAGDWLGANGFRWSLIAMFPVTTLMGYAFPLTARLFINDPAGAGRGVGIVYAVNTLGSVAGTVIAGFVLIPTIGTNASLIALTLTEVTLAGIVLVASAQSHRGRPAAVSLALVAVLGLATSSPTVRLTSTQRSLLHTDTIHEEDGIATVDTKGGSPGDRQLYVGGNGMTRLSIDTKLIAYLPKTLRPDASRILLIAFGMGSSFRSSIILGMHTYSVELSPSVPKVMRAFYPDAAHYLSNPLGHVIINDGRNFVRLSDQKYDVLAVDAPPPSESAGTVVLLTHEFYEEAKQRLNPQGVMGTFLPVDMTSCDMKAHLRTFRQSFAHTIAFVGPGSNGIFLMGSDAPLQFTQANVDRVFGSDAAQADLAGAPDFHATKGFQWFAEITKSIWLQDGQFNLYAGSGPTITDDHPLSEYFLLHNHFNHSCHPFTAADRKTP